jgi:DNA-binding transcriptional MerR regulator
MFTVGEFSRLAQVSKRLLRYYDEIGLLRPNNTDPETGYRFYSATQLPDLNRILALKELGLSLDQIQHALRDNLSTDELQGMLLLKKAEIEQQVAIEALRIRNIESRLQLIRSVEANAPLDVILKKIPAQPVLSVMLSSVSLDAGLEVFGQVMGALPANSAYGLFFGIWYRGGLYEDDVDVEIGRLIKGESHAPVPLQGSLQLTFRELPPVETMATFVVKGPTTGVHLGYSAIGAWAEVNGYRFSAEPREIALNISQLPDQSDWITEIQFPVEPVSPAR